MTKPIYCKNLELVQVPENGICPLECGGDMKWVEARGEIDEYCCCECGNLIGLFNV